MAIPKSKVAPSGYWQVRTAKGQITTSFVAAPDQSGSRGRTGFSLPVPDSASSAVLGKRMKAVLKRYLDAVAKSQAAGLPVRFVVDVNPDGEAVFSSAEGAAASKVLEQDTETPDIELQAALAAARARGRVRAGEILSGKDMLNADEFAKLLGTTRVTVNSKRQNGQVLGLDGAKRGFRFPTWQINADGKPYPELMVLHERLGGPWAVFRFLVQSHGELDGLTGRQALESGKGKAAAEAAESVGRDFR